MKLILFIFIGLFFLSCSNETSPEDRNENKLEEQEKLSLDERIKRHVESQLSIPPTEEYTLSVHKRHLNEDDLEDAVILVNRKAKALADAEEANNTPQRVATSYLGKYNFIFYYDGKQDQITLPIPMGSSALYPLKITFKKIHTQGYDDFIVEHRILDAGFQSFFTIKGQAPLMVFQWKVYDYIGTDKQELYYIDYAEGSQSLAKDILIVRGKSKQKLSREMDDIYENIEPTGELMNRFFYLPQKAKYATNASNPSLSTNPND